MPPITMIYKEQYAQILDQGDVPFAIIKKLVQHYEYIPSDVIYAVMTDDRRMGIGNLSIRYTNEEIAAHDISMKFAGLGWPVFGNMETQLKFLAGNIRRSATGFLWFVVGIPVGVVGATVGYFLGLN